MFLDGYSERSGIFNKSEYQLKQGDGLNFAIPEHKNAMSRLNDLMKRLKSHDATLFHPNGNKEQNSLMTSTQSRHMVGKLR